MRMESSRRFQLWEYRVSHGSLLIRSPRCPQERTNIDVIFDGAKYRLSPDAARSRPDRGECWRGA